MIGGVTLSSLLHKDILLWTLLCMDVMLAAGTYPTFLAKGKSFFLQTIKMPEEEMKKADTSKAANSLWHLMMIAYSGYTFLLFSSTYLCYHDETARNATGWAMLALMFAKKFAIKDPGFIEGNQELQGNKDASLNWFYFPTYGGYCLINLYQYLYG